MIEKKTNSETVRKYRQRLQQSYPGKKFLIIGSSWPKDCELIVKSIASLPKAQKDQWRVFIAPHDLSPEMIELHKSIVAESGLSCCDFKSFYEGQKEDVVIVDQLGILSELYGASDLAFIGGALHHKIHNVLEAAVYGLWVGFGPRYHNQKEAKFIAEKGLADVITSPEEGLEWLVGHGKTEKIESNKMILKYLESLRGATKQIMQTL